MKPSNVAVTFQIESWDEEAYDGYVGGRKLTHAKVKKKFLEGIIGISSLEYLMVYTAEGSASFVGLERVEGNLEGRKGSFVLQHVGTFAGGVSKATMEIVPDSGTDELKDLCGTGDFEFGHAQEFTFRLDYSFDIPSNE